MPTPVKALDNMSKNLTEEERQLRQEAEEGVISVRSRSAGDLGKMEPEAFIERVKKECEDKVVG